MRFEPCPKPQTSKSFLPFPVPVFQTLGLHLHYIFKLSSETTKARNTLSLKSFALWPTAPVHAFLWAFPPQDLLPTAFLLLQAAWPGWGWGLGLRTAARR